MSEGIPAQIGRFQLRTELGRGGFGRVYSAYDPTVGRLVAIKVLTEGGKDILTRFRNEAVVAGNLRHQNIVTVYEFGEHEGKPFLVMEYLEGEDLYHVIASHKPLTLLEKCDIMSQVAEGLFCAHSGGVVHRDVKPANIMVLGDGRVKIMDFGIARLTNDRDATRLTQQGSVVGTLLYMSPEQFSGGEIDALCDIFAYGLIFYELLTGQHPFHAADARALMYKISLEEPPPLRQFLPDCPESLEYVVARLLRKDRELRYQSLREVQFDMEPIRLALQQARAATLLVQAQELVAQKQLEPAQSVVGQVLDLDPSNQVARALWETLKKEVLSVKLQPRIDELVKAAEAYLEQRHFGEGVKSLESAARLDPSNPTLQTRLKDARTLLERARRSAALLADARAEYERQNLTAASKFVSEAVREDPQNPDVGRTLEMVERALERRRQERHVEEAIGKVDTLLLAGAFEEATSVMTELGDISEFPRAQQVVKEIDRQKFEFARRLRLNSGMAASTELLGEQRFEEAAGSLETLKAEFPENDEVASLYTYARRELDRQARSQALEKVKRDAAAMAETNDFDAALALLENALETYPGEVDLSRLLGGTISAKAEWERQRAIQAALARCEEMRSRQQFAEAIQTAEAAAREYGAVSEFAGCLERLQREWTEQRRTAAVLAAVDQAQALIAQKLPEKAAQVLREALVPYPEEPTLSAWLVRAQREAELLKLARDVDAALREADAHAKTFEFQRALDALGRGLKAWPGEKTLVRRQQEILVAKGAWERERAIQDALQGGRQLGAEKRFGEALELIALSLAQFPTEPRLLELQQQIHAEGEKQRRREAIEQIAAEARRLLAADKPKEALQVLVGGLGRYPGEAELESASVPIRALLQERERAAAIESATREAQELTQKREFDRALETVGRVLKTYPGELVLIGLAESIRKEEAQWKRQQAVAEIERQAGEWEREKRFSDALQLVARSLREYENEPLLLDTQRRLERAWQQHRRQEEVARCAAEAKSFLDNGRPDEACRLLKVALWRYPGEKDLDGLLAQSEEALRRREREEGIRRAAQEARDLAERKDFDGALRDLEKALVTWPGDETLTAVKQEVEQASAAWKYRQAIADVAARCEGLAGEGRFEEALRLAGESLEKYPEEQVLRTLRDRLHREWAQRQRNEAVNDAAGRVNALVEENRLDEALALAGEWSARYPGEPLLEGAAARVGKAIEARRRSVQAARETAAKALKDARKMAEAHNYNGALSVLERAIASAPEEKALGELQESIRAEKVGWERQQAIAERTRGIEKLVQEKRFASALEAAEAALRDYPGEPGLLQILKRLQLVRDALAQSGARQFDGAIALLQQGLTEWPEDPCLLDVKQTVTAARDAWQHDQAILQGATTCVLFQQEGRLDEAFQLACQLTETYPGNSSLADLKGRLHQARVDLERQQQRERDLDELLDIAARIPQLAEIGEAAEMLKRARGIAARYPGDGELSLGAASSIEQLEDIGQAAREIAAGHFQAVLEICGKYQGTDAEPVIFPRFRAEAARAKELAELDALSAAAGRETNLEKRERMLADAIKQFPDVSWIRDDLRATRSKLTLVASIVAKANSLEAARKWTEALEQWNSLRVLYRQLPGLDAAVARVEEARRQVRTESVAAWVAAINRLMEAGDAVKAGETLSRALAEFPQEAEIRDAAQRLERFREKKGRARKLLSEGQTACGAGRFEEGKNKFREAFETGREDIKFGDLVLQAMVRCAEAALLKGGWHRAEELAGGVTALRPDYLLPEALLQSIAAARQQEEVSQCLARADALEAAGDPRGAVLEVERGLVAYPSEPLLEQRRDGLTAELRVQREQIRGELNLMGEAAVTGEDRGALAQARMRAAEIAGRYAYDVELKAQADGVERALELRIGELSRAERGARLAVQGKRALVFAAGLAIVFGAVVAVRSFLQPPAAVSLDVTTSPAGAAVRVDDQACSGLPCRVNLNPGVHSVAAQLDGYRGATQSVKIEKSKSVAVNLVLEPLPPVVRVATNFASGGVRLDGQNSGDLQNGSLLLRNIGFGRHELSIAGPDGEAKVSFDLAPGQLPALRGRMEARNAQALAVAGIGRSAKVHCDCTAGELFLDGKTVGEIRPDGLELRDLAEGSRELKLGGQTAVLGVSAEPSLSVFLTSDRNVGTLVVETNVDSPKVLVGGREYPGTPGERIVRLPLDVAGYVVRVEKDGFQTPPSRRVQLKKGGTARVAFALVPLKATLEISDARPGTMVSIDGRLLGPVGANGRLLRSVDPGDHTVTLAQPGFVSRQLPKRFDAGRPVAITRPDTLLSPERANADPKRKEDEAAWNPLDKSDRAALQRFISQYPASAFSAEAARMIEDLDRKAEQQRREQARLEETRKAAEEEARKATEARIQQKKADDQRKADLEEQARSARAADRKAISEVIAEYAAAYRNRNVDAIVKLFPEVPVKPLRNQFNFSRSIQLTLEQGEVRIDGETATVACRRSLGAIAKDGQRMPPVNDTVVFGLRKSGGQWRIFSLQ